MSQKNVSVGRESATTVLISDGVVRIFAYVIFTVVCQLVNIFGIVTNIINILCFVQQGFNDSMNISLLGLSVSDLCCLVSTACQCIFLTPAFYEADLPFDSNDITYLVLANPRFCFTRVSSCITAMIAMEKCLSIVFPLKVKYILVPGRTTAAVVCIFITFTLSVTPVYIVNRLDWTFSTMRNRSLIAIVFADNKEEVEKITFTFNNFVIPFCSFTIVAICTIILSIQLHYKNKWRQKIISDVQADKLSNRNIKVAKMVVTISTLFIACFLPTTIVMLAVAFEPAFSVKGEYLNISMVVFGISYLMESINSSMNIFIYHHMSSKYRDSFTKMFAK